MLFFRTEKAIKRKLIFTHVSMNVQRHFAAQTGKFGKRRHRNRDVISDAASLQNDQIWMSADQLSAQMGNHANRIVLTGL